MEGLKVLNDCNDLMEYLIEDGVDCDKDAHQGGDLIFVTDDQEEEYYWCCEPIAKHAESCGMVAEWD